MDCSCIDMDVDGYCEFYNSKIVTARKNHRCHECYCNINKGDKYEYVFSKWEGSIFTVKTCLDCLSLRNAFFCGRFEHENIREEIENFIADCSGDVPESVLSKLTPRALEWACNKIEFQWSYVE